MDGYDAGNCIEKNRGKSQEESLGEVIEGWIEDNRDGA